MAKRLKTEDVVQMSLDGLRQAVRDAEHALANAYEDWSDELWYTLDGQFEGDDEALERGLLKVLKREYERDGDVAMPMIMFFLWTQGRRNAPAFISTHGIAQKLAEMTGQKSGTYFRYRFGLPRFNRLPPQ